MTVVCSASRPSPGIPGMADQDVVEIDFEPQLGAPGPNRKGKPSGGLSEKELDDVLADMLGPQNVPQKSGPGDLPEGAPHSLPTDLSRIPDGAEVVMGGGPNGPPDGTVVEIDGPPPRNEREMDELLAALEGRPVEESPRPKQEAHSERKPQKAGPPDNVPKDEEVIIGNGRNGLPPGVEVEVVGGDEPPPEMLMMGGGGPRGGPDEIPVEALRELFPPGQMIIEEDDGPGPPPGDRPPPGADAIIGDLMREMDQAMVEQVMPMAEQAAENNLPTSCSKEIKAHCRDAKSQLHCLGKYSADISDGCRADIGKSVPFLCSDAIDKYCDVLMGGILSCLDNQQSNLQGPCKDAVVATKKIIQKVNSKKPSQPAPKLKASLSAREAHLDAKLIGLSPASNAKAKPPPVMPHLQEKLLDHDMRPTESPTSHASPPFFAWFLPLIVVGAGAFAIHSQIVQVKPTTGPTILKKDPSERPLRTTSGMELLNPGGCFDHDI